MSGKSLDEIWRKMQAQQAAEHQRKIEQEKALYEQRERARQEYLQRMRMNEITSTNLAPSSSSSAGAGGGGLRRNVQNITRVSAQSYNITWHDIETDKWSFAVYNYTTGSLSSTYTTDLVGSEWNIYNSFRTVHTRGFAVEFENNSDSSFRIFFINADGSSVVSKSLDNSEDFQYTERASGYLGELDGVSTLHHFDGDVVRTHTFDIDINSIEIDDGSDDDVTQDGSMIVEAPNGEKYYIARPNGNLVEITKYMLGTELYRLDYNTDFIWPEVDTNSVSAISQDGALKNSLDISDFNMTVLDSSSLYGDNCAYTLFDNGVDTRLIISYDGDSNQFVSLTFSYLNNREIDYTERSWTYPVSSFGKNLLIASYNFVDSNSFTERVSDLNIWWLPKGASQFNHVDLSSAGTVSFVYGNENLTSNRSFTLGENPLFMYGASDSELLIGFLTSGGFVTQSTGLLVASCSNVWGHNIGEHSFAVIDVDYQTDRIWQIYDSNSIIAATQTTESWNWGSVDSRNSLRNGTLAVIDSGDASASNSFYYTTEVGLVSLPLSDGSVYNDVRYAIDTGISYEYQVISVPGVEGVDGFYLLSKSGLSEYIEFPFVGLSPSTTYDINECYIGSEIISFSLTEISTGYPRVIVYKTSNLELVYDFDPQNGDSALFSYDNRFLIETPDDPSTPESVDFTFIGVNGVETLTINLGSAGYDWVPNDAYQNTN
jgi:hypothetical protein